jgi:hypothetical protein
MKKVEEMNKMEDSLNEFHDITSSSNIKLSKNPLIIVFTFKKQLKDNIDIYSKSLEKFKYKDTKSYDGGNDFEKAFLYISNLYLSMAKRAKFYSINNCTDSNEAKKLFKLILDENFYN